MGVLPLGFQNIQGVLFTDIGQVWNENKVVQPFQRVNGSIATKDLMIGMGVGTRLFMLYFPLKFDVAWSYDLQRFSPPKYYISIGADF
jgi:outer membrane protein assembly factor BamA